MNLMARLCSGLFGWRFTMLRLKPAGGRGPCSPPAHIRSPFYRLRAAKELSHPSPTFLSDSPIMLFSSSTQVGSFDTVKTFHRADGALEKLHRTAYKMDRFPASNAARQQQGLLSLFCHLQNALSGVEVPIKTPNFTRSELLRNRMFRTLCNSACQRVGG